MTEQTFDYNNKMHGEQNICAPEFDTLNDIADAGNTNSLTRTHSHLHAQSWPPFVQPAGIYIEFIENLIFLNFWSSYR